jgi:G protein-coupled receptor kinase interacting protein 2
MQVELLIIHGANPCTLDGLGHTPEECARIAGHHQLADRLIEMQYELADKLSFFLCGRKPMHSMGEHYLIPNVAGRWATIRVLSGRKACCFFCDRQVINANE